MMKTPTTKKLSQKIQSSTTGYIAIDSDEQFFQIPKYPDLFISQYAQIIQTFKNGKSIVRKSSYEIRTGYTTIVLTNKWKKRKCFGIHDLVGQVWLEKPTFAGTDEPMQVHHKIKVKKNLKFQSININFAEHLEYVYFKYHKIADTVRSIKVSTPKGNWRSVKTVEQAAQYYRVPIITIYELLQDKPSYKADKLEYYEMTIHRKDGTALDMGIEVRKYSQKKSKK